MNVYRSDAPKCRRVSEAFGRGAGCPVVHASGGLRPGPVAVYGLLRGLKGILDQARAEGRDWYYLDNAYFGHGKFFRVTRNAYQYQGEGAVPMGLSRLEAHGVRWRAWRSSGRHIVIATQTPRWYELIGEGSLGAWLGRVRSALEAHTDRPLMVRRKDAQTPLSDALEGAWALVTHSSNAAVEAVIAGVPVFLTGCSAAAPMGLSDLSRIESPAMPSNRLHWAAHLAANQWTLDEMRDGICWRDLNWRAAA